MDFQLQPDPSGDGPESAIPVTSVAEEYEWVARNLRPVRFLGQSLQIRDERPFDVLEFVLDTGEKRKVYFDISAFY